MIVVSACLAGIDCKYNKGNNKNLNIVKLVKDHKAILICPEQLGGMSTPRKPCEIIKGDGEDVLMNQAKVMNTDLKDQTQYFIKGAYEALKIAKMYGAHEAILKANSPSCGNGFIYDGTFKGQKKVGNGVTAALFKKEGIIVLNEEEYKEYAKKGDKR